MRQIIFICLVFLLFSCGKSKIESNSKKETKTDSLEILRPSLQVYGFPYEKHNQRQVVAIWYGFRFQVMAGCEVSDSLINSIQEHNKITDSVLTGRLGPTWLKRFQKSVDSLFTVDSIAIEIARSDNYVKNFEITTEKYNQGYNYYPNLTYEAHFTPIDNQKLVTLNGYGVIYKKVRRISYLRITVDLDTKKVIHIDKTAYGD